MLAPTARVRCERGDDFYSGTVCDQSPLNDLRAATCGWLTARRGEKILRWKISRRTGRGERLWLERSPSGESPKRRQRRDGAATGLIGVRDSCWMSPMARNFSS